MISIKLESFYCEQKIDPTSVHNQVEDHWENKGLNRGNAFGGNFQGIDARPVMEEPSKCFGEDMKNLLLQGKGNLVPEEAVITLCDGVADAMGNWNNFFSLLQKENPSEEDRRNASEVAQNAVNSHFLLLGNKTPKVHVAQAHAVPQYL